MVKDATGTGAVGADPVALLALVEASGMRLPLIARDFGDQTAVCAAAPEGQDPRRTPLVAALSGPNHFAEARAIVAAVNALPILAAAGRRSGR